jgi:HEPN domain-containing protein
MPHDPILVEDTRNWLLKANEDLEVAAILINQKPPMVTGAAFHSQQAAEKVLKAFLTWHDQPFKKSHDMRRISQACQKLDATLATATSRLASMTSWAIESRYPGDWDPPAESTVADALEEVSELFRQILSRLPKETHP